MANYRAPSFPACSVPCIDGPAQIKENMNRELSSAVMHMDHTTAVIRSPVLLGFYSR